MRLIFFINDIKKALIKKGLIINKSIFKNYDQNNSELKILFQISKFRYDETLDDINDVFKEIQNKYHSIFSWDVKLKNNLKWYIRLEIFEIKKEMIVAHKDFDLFDEEPTY